MSDASNPLPTAEKDAPVIERIDRYSINVNGHRITATPAQEGALRSMDAAAVERFLHAMGRVTSPGADRGASDD